MVKAGLFVYRWEEKFNIMTILITIKTKGNNARTIILGKGLDAFVAAIGTAATAIIKASKEMNVSEKAATDLMYIEIGNLIKDNYMEKWREKQ